MMKHGLLDWKERRTPKAENKDIQASEQYLKKREMPPKDSPESSEETNENPKETTLSISATLDRLFKKSRSILTFEDKKDSGVKLVEMLGKVDELSVGDEEYEELSDETLFRKSEKRFLPVLGVGGAIDRDRVYKILERPGFSFKGKTDGNF